MLLSLLLVLIVDSGLILWAALNSMVLIDVRMLACMVGYDLPWLQSWYLLPKTSVGLLECLFVRVVPEKCECTPFLGFTGQDL